MISLSVKPGDIIRSERWPSPLKVDRVVPIGEAYVQVIGSLLYNGQHVDQILSREAFEGLRQAKIEVRFDAPPRDLFLALEAKRYRYASLYDPLLAMNISKVDPLPHQIEAVYGYILRQPRVRFLIADDPGAGKTIMAGLVIKEMKLRGLARRILIVAPGHLRDQWRREMKDRFEEKFTVIDRTTMRQHFGENVWEREFQVITSLDFARQEDVKKALEAVHWDLVIVDEAHKMAAYRYGKKVSKTKRYQLGELLSRYSTHLLFLTATPHRGDAENFRLFLDLLQPGAFATAEMLEASIHRGDNPLFIRRLKEDLKDFEGRPLFLPRHVKTMTFDLGRESPAEKRLYNDLSRYVNEQYNKALSHDKRRNIAFALVILQRRLASSTYALYQSLQRRKAKLETMLAQADHFRRGRLTREEASFSLDEVEEMSEEERWKMEALWETLSVAENRAELEAEIRTLEALIQEAKAIIDRGDEVKLRRFKEAFDALLAQEPEAKVLIFTESRDTLTYLERRLRDWGYSTCTIHGGMPLEDRIEAERVFKNKAQVMVATEAAGEGINLQFCHLMINYDIPWNPNRLEQRMGRIHRYGQTHEVTIFNLVAADTREGRVLNRLFEKLKEIRAALGSDKVFDVIDELFPGRNLAQLLTEAAANARTLEEILREIEVSVDEAYLQEVRIRLGESLARRNIDYTRMREMNARAREQRLIPEYTQAFFQRAWRRLGGVIRPRKEVGREGYFVIEKVPAPIRELAKRDEFRRRFGTLQRRYPLVTFDKELAMRDAKAEFLAFGHPLFEAVLQWAEEKLLPHLQQGATFLDPDGRMDGVLLFFEGQISDGTGEVVGKRLFALYAPRTATGRVGERVGERRVGEGNALAHPQTHSLAPPQTHPKTHAYPDALPPPRTKGEALTAISPAIIWDLAPAEHPAEAEEIDVEALRSQALVWLIPHLEAYRAELLAERRRQATIKRKYGLESLRYLISELDRELIHLQARALEGEEVQLPIRNKQQQKERYLQAMRELKAQLERETQLTLETPKFLSALRVLPMLEAPGKGTGQAEMHTSAEIERVGMEVAMRYERAQGRRPQDVAAENLGYDIRSTDAEGHPLRYIEVKARAGVGRIALTQNEWFTAQRLGEDFYLYVVFNAATDPRLYIIHHPAQHLEPETRTEVRYLVEAEAITRQGEAAP